MNESGKNRFVPNGRSNGARAMYLIELMVATGFGFVRARTATMTD